MWFLILLLLKKSSSISGSMGDWLSNCLGVKPSAWRGRRREEEEWEN